MADLTITNTNVIPDDGATVEQVVAGEVIDAGEMVYLDSTDSNKAKLALGSGTSAQAEAVGMALSDAVVAGQRFLIAKTGSTVTIGTGTVGEIYVLSIAGKISPEADLASTEYLTIVGYGSDTNKIKLLISATGIVHA